VIRVTDDFLNAFIGATGPPAPPELRKALGRAAPLWDELVRALAAECGVDETDWHSYSKKAGWSLRAKLGGRTIVYLAPSQGKFRASFALGQKALHAARASALPATVVASMDAARTYAEGTAVRVEVRSPADVDAVVKIAQAKARSRAASYRGALARLLALAFVSGISSPGRGRRRSRAGSTELEWRQGMRFHLGAGHGGNDEG
jgi:hypothetical protein